MFLQLTSSSFLLKYGSSSFSLAQSNVIEVLVLRQFLSLSRDAKIYAASLEKLRYLTRSRSYSCLNCPGIDELLLNTLPRLSLAEFSTSA